jgi:hypothetical protein
MVNVQTIDNKQCEGRVGTTSRDLSPFVHSREDSLKDPYYTLTVMHATLLLFLFMVPS